MALERTDDVVKIRVADTGIGLTPEESAKLFKEFVRIKNEDTYKIMGSGLGLSTVRKLAQLYEGDAAVKSEKGSGSIFTIHPPRCHRWHNPRRYHRHNPRRRRHRSRCHSQGRQRRFQTRNGTLTHSVEGTPRSSCPDVLSLVELPPLYHDGWLRYYSHHPVAPLGEATWSAISALPF